MKAPTVLSISSHVVAGRVGLSASCFAFSRLGISVWPLPTVLYPVTPQPGAPTGSAVPQEIFDLVLAGLGRAGALAKLSALHVGYLRTPAQVEAVERTIALVRGASPKAPICLDPILGDEPRGLYIPEATAQAIKARLMGAIDIATPNLFELGFLTGTVIRNEGDAIAAARSLKARLVVVTSAPHEAADLISNLLVAPDHAWRVSTQRFATAPHGTGDLLAALFLARLLNGEAAPQALGSATASVHDLIRAANAAGLDHLPIIESQEGLITPLTKVALEEIR